MKMSGKVLRSKRSLKMTPKERGKLRKKHNEESKKALAELGKTIKAKRKWREQEDVKDWLEGKKPLDDFIGEPEKREWIEFEKHGRNDKFKFNKLPLIFLLSIFLFSFVSSVSTTTSTIQTLGTFKQLDCITLIQTCDNCTYVNITKILYPNTSIAGTNIAMTKAGTIFNSTFCDTYTTGWYIVNTVGDLDGSSTSSSYNFQVTKSGEDFSVAKSIMYIFMLILSYFLFVLCIIGFVKIEWKDPRDVEGRIIGVNDLKYVKVLMFFLSYMILIFAFFVTYGVLNSFIYYDAITNVFKLLYTVGLYLLYPMLIFGFFLIFYIAVESKKLKKLIDRGLQP